MRPRLVLGCGTLDRQLGERLTSDQRPVRAIVDQQAEETSAWLAQHGVEVQRGDCTDPDALDDVEPAPASVLVTAKTVTADRALAWTEAARAAFDSIPLVVIVPDDTPESVRSTLREHAQVVEPSHVLAWAVLDLVGNRKADRAQRLRRTLRSIEGSLAVVMHDNPDPDAIASATALCRLAEVAGVDATPCYYGEINHQENRALVNLLDLELRQLDHEESVDDEFAGIALVDHSRPGVNDQLSTDCVVDIVIDHHPPRGPVNGRYVDLRSGVGATSTLLTEYFSRLGVALDEQVATALLYGIRIDTNDFIREISRADFEAAATLVPHVDVSVLERVESPNISIDTIETIGRAIDNRELRGDVLTTCVGWISNRDALAQAADRLLALDGVTTTFVFGMMDDMVYISARSRGAEFDLGETLRIAFDQIGSAGGHTDMAGAQLPLGMLADSEDREALVSIVSDVVTERFYDALDSSPGAGTTSIEADDAELSFLSLPGFSEYSGGPEQPGPPGGGDAET
jgi:nanoRNase/pAp phosphatase (c-di-AMP/oligoRNAs hydrolase)